MSKSLNTKGRYPTNNRTGRRAALIAAVLGLLTITGCGEETFDRVAVHPVVGKIIYGTGSLEGAIVARVGPDTPAAAAGIQPGDVIVGWDGQPIRDATELTLLVGKTEVGRTVTVDVLREGEPIEIELKVEERPTRFGR